MERQTRAEDPRSPVDDAAGDRDIAHGHPRPRHARRGVRLQAQGRSKLVAELPIRGQTTYVTAVHRARALSAELSQPFDTCRVSFTWPASGKTRVSVNFATHVNERRRRPYRDIDRF